MKAEYKYDYMDTITKEVFAQQEETDYYEERELKILHIENGVILPYRKQDVDGNAAGGVVDQNGMYVEASAQRIVGAEMNQGYPANVDKIDDATVIWFGAFHAHWGHFLTEMLGRCWYFTKDNIDWQGKKIAYIRKADSCERQLYGNYLELLELLGVKKEQLIEVTEPTRFKNVIVPELSCRAGKFFTREYVEMFNRIREDDSIPKISWEKLYFTRLQSKSLRNTQMGEKQIERAFAQNGYQVIAPEHYSLREQIAYIRNSKKIVVVAGTLPHNILFANNGIDLTIINRTGGINLYQPLISQARQARITYIDAHLSLLPVFANGPFLMQVNDNLCRYLQNNQLKVPKKKQGAISLHMQMAWYFFSYLENMTDQDIRHWKLDEKYGKNVMSTYGFYRNRLDSYDKKTICRFRKCFYIIARIFE